MDIKRLLKNKIIVFERLVILLPVYSNNFVYFWTGLETVVGLTSY